MAREAAIRVSLRKNELKSDVRSIESRFKAAGKRIGAALRAPISAGLDSAKQSISNIGGEIRNTFKMAATLGGAITVGGAVKSAMEAETAYLQLGDALSTFSKETWDAADAQAMVARVADQTKLPIEDLRTTLLQLASASGKVDIENLLERAGSQARRLGMEGDYIAEVYSRLISKGVADTAEETENLTEQFNYLFRTMLGESLQDAINPNDVGELAAFIGTTKNNAAEMLKLISMSGEKVKKDFGKANEVVEELGLSLGQTKGIDEFTKKLKLPKGVIDKNKTALENMIAIAELGRKKFDAYANALSTDTAGPALKHVIGVEFFEGKVSKKKWNLRIEELKKELADLGDLVVDRTRIEAADLRHKKTINADVNDAMNKLAETFSDERMQKAISDLSKHLPTLAEGLADLVSWIVENPWTSVAAVGGLRVGGSFVGGMAQNALPTLMGKMFNVPALGRYLAGAGGAGAAGGAIGGGRGGVAVSGGDLGLVFKGISRAGKGTIGWLAKMGGPFAGRSGIAGQAMLAAGGLAAAGAAGYAFGDAIRKQFLDPMMDKDFESWEKAGDVASSARMELKKERTIEQRQTKLKEIKEAREEQKEGPSWFSDVTGTAMSWLTDVDSPMEKRNREFRKLTTAETDTEMAIRNQMANKLKSAGKYDAKWDDMLFNMERLNVVMKAFKGTMETVNRETTRTSNSGDTWTSRGPSQVSNQSKPGYVERKG